MVGQMVEIYLSLMRAPFEPSALLHRARIEFNKYTRLYCNTYSTKPPSLDPAVEPDSTTAKAYTGCVHMNFNKTC